MDNKRFKAITGFDNYYINRKCKVWSAYEKGKWLKPILTDDGYFVVHLYKNGKSFMKKVHRLVLETFVELCPSGMQCRHLNGNRQDNRLENLCWGTASENQQDRIRHGTDSNGEKSPVAKLTEQNVKQIRELYNSKKFNQTQLADKFGVGQCTIHRIVTKKMWKHI